MTGTYTTYYIYRMPDLEYISMCPFGPGINAGVAGVGGFVLVPSFPMRVPTPCICMENPPELTGLVTKGWLVLRGMDLLKSINFLSIFKLWTNPSPPLMPSLLFKLTAFKFYDILVMLYLFMFDLCSIFTLLVSLDSVLLFRLRGQTTLRLEHISHLYIPSCW